MSTSSDRGLPPLAGHPLVYESTLDLIADTPLVEIRRLERDAPRARVFGKMEAANPGGSVKDRICLWMIERAEEQGQLGPGGVVVEPTSGNTGIGLALVCARRGYRCILTMPESMSLERRQLLESFGAELVLTPEDGQMEGAIDACAGDRRGDARQFHAPAVRQHGQSRRARGHDRGGDLPFDGGSVDRRFRRGGRHGWHRERRGASAAAASGRAAA